MALNFELLKTFHHLKVYGAAHFMLVGYGYVMLSIRANLVRHTPEKTELFLS